MPTRRDIQKNIRARQVKAGILRTVGICYSIYALTACTTLEMTFAPSPVYEQVYNVEHPFFKGYHKLLEIRIKRKSR